MYLKKSHIFDYKRTSFESTGLLIHQDVAKFYMDNSSFPLHTFNTDIYKILNNI